jgi:serine/threonine protein kinase
LFEEQPQVPKRKFDELLTAFHRSSSSMGFQDEWSIGREIAKGDFSVVHLAQNRKSAVKRAVKIVKCPTNTQYFERESSFQKDLNHPLIVGFERYIPPTQHQQAMIITEFVPNGSLADYLSSAAKSKQTVRVGETRIAMIIVGIVLAMRYLHSRDIIHRDLKPSNILIDWDGIVRICDFCLSVLSDNSDAEFVEKSDKLLLDVRYRAPECFHNELTLKSDVFSFGLIVYELLAGQPFFSPKLEYIQVMKMIVIDGVRPYIPDSVTPEVKLLIEDCLNPKPRKRPSFETILFRLDKIGFQITSGVNSRKVRRFVTAVKDREKELRIDL